MRSVFGYTEDMATYIRFEDSPASVHAKQVRRNSAQEGSSRRQSDADKLISKYRKFSKDDGSVHKSGGTTQTAAIIPGPLSVSSARGIPRGPAGPSKRGRPSLSMTPSIRRSGPATAPLRSRDKLTSKSGVPVDRSVSEDEDNVQRPPTRRSDESDSTPQLTVKSERPRPKGKCSHPFHLSDTFLLICVSGYRGHWKTPAPPIVVDLTISDEDKQPSTSGMLNLVEVKFWRCLITDRCEATKDHQQN